MELPKKSENPGESNFIPLAMAESYIEYMGPNDGAKGLKTIKAAHIKKWYNDTYPNSPLEDIEETQTPQVVTASTTPDKGYTAATLSSTNKATQRAHKKELERAIDALMKRKISDMKNATDLGTKSFAPKEFTLLERTIVPGEQDIVKNGRRELMDTEEPGRHTFQKFYAWPRAEDSGTEGGRAAYSYDPDIDGPAVCTPPSLLPSELEKIEEPERKEVMMIGLIMGRNPGKYSSEGKRKSSEYEKQRRIRGINRRDPDALRAVVYTTPMISDQQQVWVACRPRQGICHLKKINQDKVFWFSEFRAGVDPSLPLETQRTKWAENARKAAAKNRTKIGRSITLKVADNADKAQEGSAFVETEADDNLIRLRLNYDALKKTKDEQYLDGMIAIAEKLDTGLVNTTLIANTDGLDAFCDFDNAFSIEDAQRACTEVANICSVNLTAEFVRSIREFVKVEKLGHLIPHQRCAVFLELCIMPHIDNFEAMPTPFVQLWNADDYDAMVERIKTAIYSLQAMSKYEFLVHMNQEEEGQVVACMHRVLLQEIRKKEEFQRDGKDKFGAVNKWKDFKSLMDHIAKSGDQIAISSAMEQVCGMMLEMFCNRNRDDTLREIVRLLEAQSLKQGGEGADTS